MYHSNSILTTDRKGYKASGCEHVCTRVDIVRDSRTYARIMINGGHDNHNQLHVAHISRDPVEIADYAYPQKTEHRARLYEKGECLENSRDC